MEQLKRRISDHILLEALTLRVPLMYQKAKAKLPVVE